MNEHDFTASQDGGSNCRDKLDQKKMCRLKTESTRQMQALGLSDIPLISRQIKETGVANVRSLPDNGGSE